ncbi:MAG: class D sortase [Oscillospiraceae bacterium]|nr:class D sortase [Oscillospiraceae bacterium]
MKGNIMRSQNTGLKTKKQWVLFITGLIAFLTGAVILGFFGIRKICREIHRQKLLNENPVIEIADLHIKAPVLEGTENEVLAEGTGHFTGTGDFGSGNYCIAGHSSTIYKEYFNGLKNADKGMDITLYDLSRKEYVYTVSEKYIVDPGETWVLDDFGDDRITLVTCTDDGSRRQIIVGLLKKTD